MSLHLQIDRPRCSALRREGTCQKDSKDRLYPCQKVCQEDGVSLIVETQTGEPYACMQCKFDPSALSPPCMFTQRRKNASFQSLLNGRPTGYTESAQLCPVDAIKIGDEGVWIAENECVGCLLCVSACPISAITLDENLRAHLLSPHKSKENWQNACPWGAISFKKTSDEDVTEFERFKKERGPIWCQNVDLTEHLRKMEFEKVSYPTKSSVSATGVHKTNFEEFSMSDEVTKLTPWVGEALRRISDGSTVSSYEARLPNKPGMRYPRLDYCIIDSKAVLVIESKRDEGSARLRIVDQVRKKYREEIRQILSKRQIRKWNLVLAVGGYESDLCRSNYLFFLLSSNRIQMVSASFIWCLLAYNLLMRERLPWSDVIPKLFSYQEVIASLAGGIVTSDGSNRFRLVPVRTYLRDEE